MVDGRIRCGDDDFRVYELLVKLGVLAFLVRRGDESVSLILEPFANTKLVLSGAEESWNLRAFGVSKRCNSRRSQLVDCDSIQQHAELD